MYNPRHQQEINYEYTLHAKLRQKKQAVDPAEVALTVEEGTLIGVRDNKGSRRRVFRAGYNQGGRDYLEKEITVVYTFEKGSVVVVTMVTRYGQFE
jgi:metal-dependent hydrolase (beta-lactamase superfamily II)